MAIQQMSTAELLALPVTVDIVVAGRAFGLGRTKSYELAQQDDFPCQVLKLGSRYRVTKSDLLKAVGVEAQPAEQAEHQQAS